MSSCRISPNMLRAYLPKKLAARTLLIILAPSLILQGIIAYAFFERHHTRVTQRLSSITADEVALISHIYRTHAQIIENSLHLQIHFTPSGTLPQTSSAQRENSLLYRTLHEELRSALTHPFRIDMAPGGRSVVIHIQYPDGLLSVEVPLWRTYATRSHVFLALSGSAAFLLITLMILLIRNQLRSIRTLSRTMEAFGHGHETSQFVPRGPLEVRRAGRAFLSMKTRLQRAIQQRTFMLAGVSHDMRTLLTRFQLQLSLLPETKETKALQEDTQEMERILNAYLDFAQTDEQEDSQRIALLDMLQEILPADRAVTLDIPQEFTLSVRPNSFKRCLRNLLTNALTYAKTVQVRARRTLEEVEIFIEDDGPGIPREAREAVFRPFYRLDAARALKTSGRGLGLAIARDVVQAHGGTITLKQSFLGGLCVHLRFPAS